MVREMGFEQSEVGAYIELNNNKKFLYINADFVGEHDTHFSSNDRISQMGNHYLVALFDENNDLFNASVISSDENITSIETSKYTGNTALQLMNSEENEVYSADFNFINGSLTKLDWLHDDHDGGRTEYHNPIMECTGAKFATDFDLEEALCYSSFFACFVARWADCAIFGDRDDGPETIDG